MPRRGQYRLGPVAVTDGFGLSHVSSSRAGGGPLNRPFSRNQPPQPQHRVNGRIRAREVRVIGQDGQQAGIMDLPAALNLARTQGVDLVEIAATAVPPVCRLVDYGKIGRAHV
mgnify:CR=1 FL=1